MEEDNRKLLYLINNVPYFFEVGELAAEAKKKFKAISNERDMQH